MPRPGAAPLWALHGAPETWTERAECRAEAGHDPELWWPVYKPGPDQATPMDRVRAMRLKDQIDKAKAICQLCDVQPDCLAYALNHNEPDGIWGGLTEKERRRLKKRQQESLNGKEPECPQ